MKEGVIQQVDDPLELYDRPRNAFVAGFIGSPPMNLFHGSLERRDSTLWFVEGATGGSPGFAVRPNQDLAERLGAHTDHRVIFGVRPEDVYIATGAPPSGAGGAVAVTVEVVEPMGAETHLRLATAAHGFVARTTTRPRVRAGDTTHVTFDMQKGHFFDAASEALIE
jgi:multiple sugar transport system ATP-binding protein